MIFLSVIWLPLASLFAFLPFALNWYIITFHSYPIVEKYAIKQEEYEAEDEDEYDETDE
jgi:hypothetical protein